MNLVVTRDSLKSVEVECDGCGGKFFVMKLATCDLVRCLHCSRSFDPTWKDRMAESIQIDIMEGRQEGLFRKV